MDIEKEIDIEELESILGIQKKENELNNLFSKSKPTTFLDAVSLILNSNDFDETSTNIEESENFDFENILNNANFFFSPNNNEKLIKNNEKIKKEAKKIIKETKKENIIKANNSKENLNEKKEEQLAVPKEKTTKIIPKEKKKKEQVIIQKKKVEKGKRPVTKKKLELNPKKK